MVQKLKLGHEIQQWKVVFGQAQNILAFPEWNLISKTGNSEVEVPKYFNLNQTHPDCDEVRQLSKLIESVGCLIRDVDLSFAPIDFAVGFVVDVFELV